MKKLWLVEMKLSQLGTAQLDLGVWIIADDFSNVFSPERKYKKDKMNNGKHIVDGLTEL